MTFIVAKNGPKSYLGFDEAGHHEWQSEKLDAIRFDTPQEISESCGQFLRLGARIQQVDDWDGHYEVHQGYEIQVFHDGLRGKPGGHRWRYRIGPIVAGRAYEYSPGHLGYTRPELAVAAAKEAVFRKARRNVTA